MAHERVFLSSEFFSLSLKVSYIVLMVVYSLRKTKVQASTVLLGQMEGIFGSMKVASLLD